MRFGVATKLWSKATVADAAGSGGAGGYDRPRGKRVAPAEKDPAVTALFERVRAVAGTPVADTLKAFATDNNRGLKEADLAADPVYAAQIEDILNGAAA